MADVSPEQCRKAAASIGPLIGQLMGMRAKFSEGTPQHTLLIRRIAAYRLAMALVARELDPDAPDPSPTDADLSRALAAIESTRRKLQKIPPKLKEGGAQQRRVLSQIEAMDIAAQLVSRYHLR